MKNWLIKLFSKRKVRTYEFDPMDHIFIGMKYNEEKLKRIKEGQKVDDNGFLTTENNKLKINTDMDFNVTKKGNDFVVNKLDEMEKCVSCGEQTTVPVSMNINFRKFYIEGAGQLCKECYDKIN